MCEDSYVRITELDESNLAVLVIFVVAFFAGLGCLLYGISNSEYRGLIVLGIFFMLLGIALTGYSADRLAKNLKAKKADDKIKNEWNFGSDDKFKCGYEFFAKPNDPRSTTVNNARFVTLPKNVSINTFTITGTPRKSIALILTLGDKELTVDIPVMVTADGSMVLDDFVKLYTIETYEFKFDLGESSNFVYISDDNLALYKDYLINHRIIGRSCNGELTVVNENHATYKKMITFCQ